jgi:regulator of replication initiation timing
MENSCEATIQTIDKKIRQLAAQNAHYKRICNDLLATKKQLEQENATLRQQLHAESAQNPNLENNPKTAPQADFEQEKAFLKQQIQQHIQHIDACAEWISQLP